MSAVPNRALDVEIVLLITSFVVIIVKLVTSDHEAYTMCFGFGGAKGAFFLSVCDFTSLWYLGVGDEEDGVGRRNTA